MGSVGTFLSLPTPHFHQNFYEENTSMMMAPTWASPKLFIPFWGPPGPTIWHSIDTIQMVGLLLSPLGCISVWVNSNGRDCFNFSCNSLLRCLMQHFPCKRKKKKNEPFSLTKRIFLYGWSTNAWFLSSMKTKIYRVWKPLVAQTNP